MTAHGDFLNLRKVELMRFSNDELTRMTNIEKLKNDESVFVIRHEGISFPFLANPDRVTSISLRKKDIDLNSIMRFTNLKSLKYGDEMYNKANYVLRNVATSIQKLVISGKHYYDFYNLTNLTSLKVDMLTEHFPSITSLHKLKKLDVGRVSWTNADREALDLAPLTALESLIWRNTVFKQVFATIQSPHLTYLEMETFEGLDLGQLVSLQNSLKDLLLKESRRNTEYVDYSPVSQFTGLVSLRISYYRSLTNIDALTNLTRLEVKYIYTPEEKGRDWSLSKLTNLERLSLSSARAEFLNDIVPLTSKLTYLEVKLTSEHLARNTTCLGTMTNLQALHLHAALNDILFWQDLPKLTKLHSLTVWKVDSEEKLILLSTLTNLTTLNVLRSKTLRGDELTRLTSLQTLTFVSKVAKATIGKPKAYKNFSAKMPRLYQFLCSSLK